MERETYEKLSTKLDYETFIKCYCPECEKENCFHRGAYIILPNKAGFLGLCANLLTYKN